MVTMAPMISPIRLLQVRSAQMLSQQSLAERAGLSVGTVSRIERGLGKPTLKTIRKLANALEIEHGVLIE